MIGVRKHSPSLHAIVGPASMTSKPDHCNPSRGAHLIATRTVNTHLEHIDDRLEIESRAALAAITTQAESSQRRRVH